MTKQEYKDLLIKVSENDGFPCMEGNICCYRSGNKKCVIGWCIPEEDYKPEFEVKTVLGLMHKCDYNVLKNVDGITQEELIEIQNFHDTGKVWDHILFVNMLDRVLDPK